MMSSGLTLNLLFHLKQVHFLFCYVSEVGLQAPSSPPSYTAVNHSLNDMDRLGPAGGMEGRGELGRLWLRQNVRSCVLH